MMAFCQSRSGAGAHPRNDRNRSMRANQDRESRLGPRRTATGRTPRCIVFSSPRPRASGAAGRGDEKKIYMRGLRLVWRRTPESDIHSVYTAVYRDGIRVFHGDVGELDIRAGDERDWFSPQRTTGRNTFGDRKGSSNLIPNADEPIPQATGYSPVSPSSALGWDIEL